MKNDPKWDDLTRYKFHENKSLTIIAYKLLQAIKNPYIDSSPDAKAVVSKIETLIRDGSVNKHDVQFYFRSHQINGVYQLASINLNIFAPTNVENVIRILTDRVHNNCYKLPTNSSRGDGHIIVVTHVK